MTMPASHPLIAVLEVLVLEREQRDRVEGVLAIGVRTREREVWWRAELGDRRTSTTLGEERPPNSDCWVLIGEHEANAILDTGRLPPDIELLDARGDVGLFARFVDEFAKTSSLLDL